jgi:hypothetical protein
MARLNQIVLMWLTLRADREIVGKSYGAVVARQGRASRPPDPFPSQSLRNGTQLQISFHLSLKSLIYQGFTHFLFKPFQRSENEPIIHSAAVPTNRSPKRSILSDVAVPSS